MQKGYLRVYLYKNGIRKAFSAHRLIATMFVPNPENKPEVNHKKGIKGDIRASQLEWTTTQENVRHRFDVLGQKQPSGADSKFSKPVEKLSLDGRILNTYPSTVAARKDGIDAKALHKCLHGKIESARGFIWRFKKVTENGLTGS